MYTSLGYCEKQLSLFYEKHRKQFLITCYYYTYPSSQSPFVIWPLILYSYPLQALQSVSKPFFFLGAKLDF